jgi:uncharacterized repeat protein (TIGR01451 family)
MKKQYTLILIALIGFYGNAQVVNIPDPMLKAKLLSANNSSFIAKDVNGQPIAIDINNDGEIQISETTQVADLDLESANITDLTGILSFSNLRVLNCNDNQLIALELSGLPQLTQLFCSSNQLTTINVTTILSLNVLDCSNNQLTTLNVNGLANLTTLICSSNVLTSIDPSGLVNLIDFECSNNQISFLSLNGLVNLQIVACDSNQITSLDVTSSINLISLQCYSNVLSTLNVSGLTQLINLSCGYNQLTSLNVNGLNSLIGIDCQHNQITALDLTGLSTLTGVSCSNNQLTSLEVSALSLLEYLYCGYNQLTSLDVSGLSHLISVDCTNNQLIALNVTNTPQLNLIFANYNQITVLDLATSVNLHTLLCNDNLLTLLDVSTCPFLQYLFCDNNLLNTLILKNGTNEDFHLSGNPTLQYICADEGFETDTVLMLIDTMPNCHVNSYCSFVPGGTFYTLQGTSHFDNNSNGCEGSDPFYPNFKLNISDGSLTSTIISNYSGHYQYAVQTLTQTLTPVLENPNYFTVSPSTSTITFSESTSPYIQDFCIAPNGNHSDLEVTLFPYSIAIPGFEAVYVLNYKNKGTTVQSGTITFSYDDSRSDFVSAEPNIADSLVNLLRWDFSNLMPFETRQIVVVLNINSPSDIPAVTNGDELYYTASFTATEDENPIDNSCTLSQVVVNSYDPNDKTCIEGTTITPSMVGNYVHYIIRFENDGTANAQNIVVKDLIDTSKFDITSLVPLSGSASYVTRITDTNQVEFVFENINLPFAANSNRGYVVFKIKTKPSLVLNDAFSNTASIFFDYNTPIVTNTATTTVGILANQDFDYSTYFDVYPIPAKQVLNLQLKRSIGLMSVAIYNSLGQLVLALPSVHSTIAIDVSSLQTGSYFLKLFTDKGIASTKFIKK